MYEPEKESDRRERERERERERDTLGTERVTRERWRKKEIERERENYRLHVRMVPKFKYYTVEPKLSRSRCFAKCVTN